MDTMHGAREGVRQRDLEVLGEMSIDRKGWRFTPVEILGQEGNRSWNIQGVIELRKNPDGVCNGGDNRNLKGLKLPAKPADLASYAST